MYCVQNRIYCGVCHISVLVDNYSNHLKTQGHINNILKNQCTSSNIKKTPYKKK